LLVRIGTTVRGEPEKQVKFAIHAYYSLKNMVCVAGVFILTNSVSGRRAERIAINVNKTATMT
jgi:hypothetical protein